MALENTVFDSVQAQRFVGTSTSRGIVVPSLTSDPSSPSTAEFWFNSTVSKFKGYNGSSVINVSGESGAGGVGGLDDTYSNGQAITIDEGPITLTDSTTGALNTLVLTKSGAGSGNVLDLNIGAALTGNAIDIDMNLGIAAKAIYIDNGATARTGADINVLCDSTGAHSVIDIDASGSGAAVGFDYQGSFNGSPGGQAMKVTLDAADALDTEIMEVTTGSGDRNVMFDLNFGHTDSGTTSHIFDIDVTAILDSNVFDFATTAACTGNVIFLDLDNGLAMTGLHIEGSGVRTQPMLEVITDSTSSADLIDISVDGAITGDAVEIDMNLGLAARALVIDAGAGTRTANLVDVIHDGAGNTDVMGITATNTGTGSLFDIDMNGVGSTGGVFNIDMNAAVGAPVMVLDAGAGARTADMIDVTFDGSGNVGFLDLDCTNTGTGNLIDVDVTGIHAGNVLDIGYATAASTGDAIVVAMGTNVAGSAVVLSGAGARTDDLIKIDDSGTGSAHIFDINFTGIYTGNCLDIAYATAAATGDAIAIAMGTNVAGSAIYLTSAGARTDDLIKIDDSSTGNSHIFDIDLLGAYTGNVLDIGIGAVLATGDLISLALGATAVGSQAIVITSGAMTRTTDLISITDSGTPSGDLIQINMNGASTGNVLNVDMDLALGAPFLLLDAGNGVRTADLIDVTFDGSGNVSFLDLNCTNTGSGDLLDIDVTGIHTGDVLDIVYGTAASTGRAIHVDMGTNLAGNALLIDAAGVRTAPLISILNTGTDAGTDDHVISVLQSGLLDSNLVNLVFGTAASTGHAIHVDMGTDLAGNALLVDAAGVRTAPLINILNTGTDGGTDDHVISILQSGLLDSNLVNLVFGTAASTGDAISVVMDTNVAGMAMTVSSAGTGVSGEGNVINVAHTGDLVAGADVVRIRTTGNISSTSNVLAIEQATGAGTAGAYCVYVSATGTNVEAIKVDDGKVVFDETLEVTGASTLTGAVTATAGCQSSAVAVTATVDGLTTGLIPSGARYVTATAGADANSIVTLPTAVVGNIISMFIGATGCEVRTPAASNVTINNVDSDGTNEAAIPANTLCTFTCTTATSWLLEATNNLGATVTAIVPDAA